MKKNNFLYVVIFILIIQSCANREELTINEASLEEFTISIGRIIDNNINKGVIFSQLKPAIIEKANSMGITVRFPSKTADSTVLDEGESVRAYCWPWEEVTAEAFYHFGDDGSLAVLYIYYCDGEYDDYEFKVYE